MRNVDSGMKVYFGDVTGDVLGGPRVKLARMATRFENTRTNYSLVYALAGCLPFDEIIRAARRGIPVVQHVNSFYHRAYRGERFGAMNSEIERIYALADGIVYGSNHVREAAHRFFGARNIPERIIYNAVDTERFCPQPIAHDGLRILCIGNHYIRHRVEPLIRALPLLKKRLGNVTLCIAGPLHGGEGIFDCSSQALHALADSVGVSDCIDWRGNYSQEEAPGLFNACDVVVHLKHMDWTPNTLVEAMACGVAIVHAGNGGVPELVGDAGISLEVPDDWDHICVPDEETIVQGICTAVECRSQLVPRARRRACELFTMDLWCEQHRAFFAELLHQKNIAGHRCEPLPGERTT